MSKKDCEIYSKSHLVSKAFKKLHITRSNAESFKKHEICAALETCTGKGLIFPDAEFEMKIHKKSGTIYLLPRDSPLSYRDYEILVKGGPQKKLYSIATNKMDLKVDKKEEIGELLNAIKDKLREMNVHLDPIKINVPKTNTPTPSRNLNNNLNRNLNNNLNRKPQQQPLSEPQQQPLPKPQQQPLSEPQQQPLPKPQQKPQCTKNPSRSRWSQCTKNPSRQCVRWECRYPCRPSSTQW